MLRNSASRAMSLRTTLRLLSTSSNTAATSSQLGGTSSEYTGFPDDAAWLGGSAGVAAPAPSSNALATQRPASGASSVSAAAAAAAVDDALSSSGPAALTTGEDYSRITRTPGAGVPVGIRHTTTESVMLQMERRQVAGFGDVKSDVAVRARRALSVSERRTDHFLLAELDPDLDTVMFGTDPAEFEENVRRMKVIVSTYTRWERWDKIYTYATRGLQLGTCVFLFLWWEAVQEKYLLQTAAEDYAAQHTMVLQALGDARTHAVEYLVQELHRSPPGIMPTSSVATTATGAAPSYLRPGDAEGDIRRHPMDTRPDAEFERERAQKLVEAQAVASAAAGRGVSDTDFMKRARRVMLPMSDDWTAVVREEMAEYQNRALDNMRFPRETA